MAGEFEVKSFLLRSITILLLTTTVSKGLSAPKKLTDDLEKNQKQTTALTLQLKKLTKNYSEAEKKTRAFEKKIAITHKQILNTQTLYKIQQERIQALQTELAAVQTEMTQHKQALTQQLRIAYQKGPADQIKLLLTGLDPNHWATLNHSHRYFFDAHTVILEKLNLGYETIQSLQDEHTVQLRHLATTKSDLIEQKKKITSLKSEQTQWMAKLKRKKDSSEHQLKSLKQQRKELESLLAQWKSQAINTTSIANRKGNLKWPVNGRISNQLNSLKVFKSKRKGVFIKAKPGSSVFAVHSGRVIFADWLRGYGLMCIIDHGDGYLSLYGHNQMLTKQPGDLIKTGEQLGQVGKSGGARYSGIYFELRHKGLPTNPTLWMSKK